MTLVEGTALTQLGMATAVLNSVAGLITGLLWITGMVENWKAGPLKPVWKSVVDFTAAGSVSGTVLFTVSTVGTPWRESMDVSLIVWSSAVVLALPQLAMFYGSRCDVTRLARGLFLTDPSVVGTFRWRKPPGPPWT